MVDQAIIQLFGSGNNLIIIECMQFFHPEDVKLEIETLRFTIYPKSIAFRTAHRQGSRSYYLDIDKGTLRNTQPCNLSSASMKTLSSPRTRPSYLKKAKL